MEASSGEIDSAASGVVRWPVRVETGHYAHPVAPEVYDCVKFLLAREGSGTITGDWGERRFRMGDLMLVGSGLAIGGAPDGTATTSTIFADKDYVMDQVYWRYADVLQDRTAAETVMQRAFGTGAIMIRLNPDPPLWGWFWGVGTEKMPLLIWDNGCRQTNHFTKSRGHRSGAIVSHSHPPFHARLR